MALLNTIQDPMLQKVQQAQQQAVPKENQKDYANAMAAGLKLMFNEATFPEVVKAVSSIKSPEQIPQVVAHGIVKAMSILFNESKGHFPIKVYGPVALSLMAHALEYVETKKKAPIDKEVLANTASLVNQGMVRLVQQYMKLSDQDMQQILSGTHPALPNRKAGATENSQPAQAAAQGA